MIRPSDIAQAVLAWKDLAAERREATRGALALWLKEADELLLVAVDEQVAETRASNPREHAPSRRDPRWAELAAKHLPLVADASGATWLVDPAAPRPEFEGGDYVPLDAELTGTTQRYLARQAAIDTARRPADFEPRPFCDEARTRIVVAYGATDDARATLTELFAQHAAAWTELVQPKVVTLRESSAPAGGGLSEGDRKARAASIDAARRAAYDAARVVDDALFDGLAAVVESDGAATALRLRAARELDEMLERWKVDPGLYEYFGGIPFNFAEALDDPEISPAARRAVTVALADTWRVTIDTLRGWREEQFQSQLDELLGKRDASKARPPRFGGMTSDPVARRQIDLLRAAAAEAMSAALTALEKNGEDVAATRFALERRRFPYATGSVSMHWKICEAVRDLPDFEGKTALSDQLRLADDRFLRVSRREIDLTLPLVAADPPDATSAVRNPIHSGMRYDLNLVNNNLIGAELWLIVQRTPPEILAKSEYLVKAARSNT